MTLRNLEHLFRPSSVAVIGASDKAGSVGATVMRNLLASAFAGAIIPVNPHHRHVAGIRTSPDVGSLLNAPELAVICTPARVVPDIIRQLGQKGTKAAVVLSVGLSHQHDPTGYARTWRMLEQAKPYGLRILGPNSAGLLVPGIGLNASCAYATAHAGTIAFIAQTGALTTTLLDWADACDIGFSHFVSLGDCADVGFGDVLEYLAGDRTTSAILLHIESILPGRQFISAARAAARIKPVIALKACRNLVADSPRPGALRAPNSVYDAALCGAGILRVEFTQELFNVAESIARAHEFH